MRLLALAVWAAALVFLTIVSSGILTSLLALVGLIVVPGAALALGLLPVGKYAKYGIAVRAVGSLGFGLAFAILAGILLDLTPFGIRWTPLLLGIVAVVSIAILAGIGRQAGPVGISPVITSLTSRQVALLGFSVLMAVSAFGLARVGASATSPNDVQQLWILPDAAGSVQVGIANHTGASQEYRLVLNLDGQDIKEWSAIQLQPGETWKGAPDAVIPKGHLRATLFRSDLPTSAIREVSVSLPAAGG
jgi:uncharacterized membrane protein